MIGFNLNSAVVSPRKVLPAGCKKQNAAGRNYYGWNEHSRARVAAQVSLIKHWQIIEGNWSDAPRIDATWFVDPPYNNKSGSLYVYSNLDYAELAKCCQILPGQVIVCENEGANWLPFKPLGTFQINSMSGKASREVIWLGGSDTIIQP